jgi:hypothetical protein
MRMVAVFVLAALALPAWSQEPTKPGPEHKMLKALEGEWTSTMKFGDMESKGTVKYKMVNGGLWLSSAMESKLGDANFQGRGMETYNPARKKYLSIWTDSFNTAPIISEGTYDKEKKVLTMAGQGPGKDGEKTKYRSTTKFTDKNTMEFTMWIGDTKEPTFTVTYKRKKK